MRRARAPTERPRWASSPAACTAVPTSSMPLAGGRVSRRGGSGAPRALCVAADGRTPAGLVALAEDGRGGVDVAAVRLRGAARGRGGRSAGSSALTLRGGPSRLLLRRCGRARGRLERTSSASGSVGRSDSRMTTSSHSQPGMRESLMRSSTLWAEGFRRAPGVPSREALVRSRDPRICASAFRERLRWGNDPMVESGRSCHRLELQTIRRSRSCAPAQNDREM